MHFSLLHCTILKVIEQNKVMANDKIKLDKLNVMNGAAPKF